MKNFSSLPSTILSQTFSGLPCSLSWALTISFSFSTTSGGTSSRCRKSGLLGGDVHRDVLHEGLEELVARDEVGLAVDLHQDADLAAEVDVAAHRALGGRAGCLLGRRREPLLAQPSSALAMSPPASVSAFLQSIIPAPVFSRSSLTSCALISMACSSSVK